MSCHICINVYVIAIWFIYLIYFDLTYRNNRITTEGAVLLGKGLTVNETLKVVKVYLQI